MATFHSKALKVVNTKQLTHTTVTFTADLQTNVYTF